MSFQRKILSEFNLFISDYELDFLFPKFVETKGIKEKSYLLHGILKHYDHSIKLKDCLNFSSQLLYSSKYDAITKKNHSLIKENKIEKGSRRTEHRDYDLFLQVEFSLSPKSPFVSFTKYLKKQLKGWFKVSENRNKNHITLIEYFDEQPCNWPGKTIHFESVNSILSAVRGFPSEKLEILKSITTVRTRRGDICFKKETSDFCDIPILTQLILGLTIGNNFHLKGQAWSFYIRNYETLDICLNYRSHIQLSRLLDKVLSAVSYASRFYRLFKRVRLIDESGSGEFKKIFKTFNDSVILTPVAVSPKLIKYAYQDLERLWEEITLENWGNHCGWDKVYKHLLGYDQKKRDSKLDSLYKTFQEKCKINGEILY